MSEQTLRGRFPTCQKVQKYKSRARDKSDHLQEPDFGSSRNILLRNIGRQHDHHATRANVLLCELDGSDMGLKYAPVWSAEFNLVLRSYPKVQTFRDSVRSSIEYN
jgi:hypothetical protein